jgi:AraC-like DNA-binding protein
MMTLVDKILESLKLQSAVFCRMTLSGNWGFAKDSLNGAPFHILLSGSAWVISHEPDSAFQLFPGDIIVKPHGEKHRLVSKPDAKTIPFRDVANAMGLSPWVPGTRYKAVDLSYGNGESKTTLISGIFEWGNHRRNPLVDALPSTLLMRAKAGSTPAIITALMDTELLSGLPGADCVGAKLADILFIQIVRHHLASEARMPQGWLRGITDKDIAPALAIIHHAPEKSWSVEALGREFGMSRSRFAKRFHDVVGQGPLEYLTQWRMYVAAEKLAEGNIVLPAVASSVGYSSEVSFSKAFKRWSGQSPAQFRRASAEAEMPIAGHGPRSIQVPSLNL